MVETVPTRRVPVTRWLETRERGRVAPGHGDAIVGTLVHRLLQSWDGVQGRSDRDQLVHARNLLRAEERAAVPDVELTVRTATAMAERITARDDVRSLLGGGQRLYEVPFSLRAAHPSPSADADRQGQAGLETGSLILRGTIDCLVVREDGSVLVLEIKTGVPRPSHQQQLDIYLAAARALFPAVPVTGQLIYA